MNKVVASWSGGIDSTAVLAHLLYRGWEVKAVTLTIYGNKFGKREGLARERLKPFLQKVADDRGGRISYTTKPADWIWAFSPDGVEIPRRNKHIMDHLITTEMIPIGVTNLAMGEYIGADTWLVKNHVAAADADHRSLSAYLFQEYGLSYRLLSLQDFGESRYKSNRMKLGWAVIGPAMMLTSNCLIEGDRHCGKCYKCLERRAALLELGHTDETEYEIDPEVANPTAIMLYQRQMRGELVNLDFAAVNTFATMPGSEVS